MKTNLGLFELHSSLSRSEQETSKMQDEIQV
mgnify:CR=1 FL=1